MPDFFRLIAGRSLGLAFASPSACWVVDAGPLALAIVCLWIKLAHVSVLLPGLAWASEERLDLSDVVRAYPHVFSATLACLLLLLAPLLWLPRVWRFGLLLALNLALTSLAVADLAHVRFYADVSSSSDIASTHMLAWVIESVLTLLRPLDAVYYLDAAVGIVALPFYMRACKRAASLGREHTVRLSAGLLIAGLILSLPTARLVSSDTRGIFAYTTIRLEAAAVVGVLPYHVAEAIDSLTTMGRTIGEPERQRIREFLDQARQKQAPPASSFGIAARSNVIIISAESIQAFPIGLEVLGQPVAPRLTALAGESMYFTNFYEQTHLGSTSDAEFAVMQSLFPLPVGVVASRYARNHYRGLPAILAEQGYSTFSAVAARSHFWNMNQLHPRYGFQRSFYEDSYQMTEQILVWLSDREFFRQTMPMLEAQAEPFLGFLLSSSSHHPYAIPEQYRRLRLGELEGTMLGGYLHAVHYFDQELGAFVDGLRETGLLDRSVLVVYGDHQAFLGDLPELPRLLGLPRMSEYERFRVIKKTPLFIRLPHGEAAGVKTVTAGQVDVAPTLLGLLGIVDHSVVMLGRDLAREGDSLVVFRDGSFADGSHFFVNRFGPAFASRCYEAESGRTLGCELLEARRQEARQRLEISDLIVQGDLIPSLALNR